MLHRTDGRRRADAARAELRPDDRRADLPGRPGRRGRRPLGITHLVEHLALHRHGVAEYHYNGATGSVVTQFHMQGTERDIVTYLEMVCDSLADRRCSGWRPRRRSCAPRRPARGGVNGMLPMWRYGARDYGLVSYPEWGIDRLGPDDVRPGRAPGSPARTPCCGSPATGSRRACGCACRPGAPPGAGRLDGAAGDPGVLHRRRRRRRLRRRHARGTAAGSVFALMLERELFQSLRQESGLSYAASASYDPRGDGMGGRHRVRRRAARRSSARSSAASSTSSPGSGSAGSPRPSWSGPREARRGAAPPRRARRPAAGPGHRPAHRRGGCAPSTSCARSCGPSPSPTCTAPPCRSSAGAAAGAPPGSRADWAGSRRRRRRPRTRSPGTRTGRVDGSGASLVLGADGVSIVEGECRATVRYRSCAVVHAWPDGARQLIGLDGIAVLVEPALFAAPADTAARIDRSVDPSIVLPMPARNPHDVPRPSPAPATGTFPPSTGTLPAPAGGSAGDRRDPADRRGAPAGWRVPALPRQVLAGDRHAPAGVTPVRRLRSRR